MTDIQFYHLTHPLERILPKLLEKSLAGGFRTLVVCESEEKVEKLTSLLWTYDPASFLPHGSEKDGNAESQPIYLSTPKNNPNQADLIMVTEGSEIEELQGIRRVLDMVEGRSEAALAGAKERMKSYRAAGHTVSCVRQTASGGWEKADAA